ncbi:MAG: hypothetical protein AB7H77_09280 [Bdellovibrionales bacterium]
MTATLLNLDSFRKTTHAKVFLMKRRAREKAMKQQRLSRLAPSRDTWQPVADLTPQEVADAQAAANSAALLMQACMADTFDGPGAA